VVDCPGVLSITREERRREMDDTGNDIVSVEICTECMRHAHFMCGGEEISGELFSQRQAEELAEDFLQDGDLSHAEFDRLMLQIRRSGLPMEIPHEMKYLLDLDDDLLAFEGSFSEAGSDDEMDNLHDFLKTFFPEAPVIFH